MQETVLLKPIVLSELNPKLDVELITDESGLERVHDFLKHNSVFGLDIETNVVDHYFDRRIRTIQVGNRERQYVIDLLPFAERAGVKLVDTQGLYVHHECLSSVYKTLKPFLDSREHLKVGHNLNFEYETLKWCFGLRTWNLYDTMWAEKVIHAGEWPFKASGYWALDDLVGRYTGMAMSKDEQTSFDLVTPLREAQWLYGAIDVRVLFNIKNAQRQLIEKANLWKAVQIENDAIPAFGDMHLNGILLSLDPWREVLREVEEWHKVNVARMDEFFIPIVGTKDLPANNLEELAKLEELWRNEKDKEKRAEYRKAFMSTKKKRTEVLKSLDTFEGNAAINYSSPAQILVVLRKLGYDAKKLPSTDDDALKKASGNPFLDMKKALKQDPTLKKYDVIDVIRLYRETGKILVMYGDKFVKKHVRFLTGTDKFGYIHSRINQLGAETGRTSSSKPNIQNIPRDDKWRSCFVSPPGYKMLTLDYNGCELRILAEYSREKIWLDAFKNGWDVHSVGAEIIFGQEWKDAAEEGCAYYAEHQKCKCKKHKELRDQIKSINFGIAYGMEAKKLAGELGITEAAAQLLLTRYKEAFPTLVKYLEKCGKNATMKLESRTLAQRRRAYKKPDWAVATKKAQERRGRVPSTREISQAYKGMYAAIEREGKNTPIQGSNADIAKIAMGCGFDANNVGFLWHHLEPTYEGRQVNFVHDEIVATVPEDRAEVAMKMIGDCMTRAGSELVRSIPMTWEGKIDTCWRK